MKPGTLVISVLALAALALGAYELVQLLQVGTCASGGPYVSARQCPDGTAGHILLLMLGFGTYIVCTVVASFRSLAGFLFWFGLLFTVLGATFLAAEATDSITGGGGVGWILGGVFLPMGLLPLYGGIRAMWEDRDDEGPAMPAGPYVFGSVLQQPPSERR